MRRRQIGISHFVAAIVLTAAVLLPVSGTAQATAYVPLTDPAYRDLEALIVGGLVRELMLGSRPYSRANVVRAIEEAKRRLVAPLGTGAQTRNAAAAPARTKLRVQEALTRLESRFGGGVGGGLRGAELGVAIGDTPARPARGYRGTERIDADIAPLVQRNNGQVIPDGSSISGEFWGDMEFRSRFAAAVQPRVRLSAPRAGGAGIGAELATGYVRAQFGNAVVDLGRNTLARGYSRDMSPTLSTNARALDMVRVATERSTHLPWVFRYLGPWTAAGTLAYLGDNRDNPGGMLIVWEGNIRPAPIVTLGLTLVSQQGGKGTPPATLTERILESLFISKRSAKVTTVLWRDPQIGDKYFGADARVSIPGTGVEAYAEFGTSDDHELFFTHPHAALVDEAAWLGGIRWRGLGRDGRLDLWAEAAHNGVDSYVHAQMTSGLTLDRRVFGSPLGPLAAALQGGGAWTGQRTQMSITGAWERYSGDDYEALQSPINYVRTADNPDEVRLRMTAEWARSDERSRLTTRIKLGYESTTRFAFTENNRANVSLQAGLGWAW
jgi:hypothetical protein